MLLKYTVKPEQDYRLMDLFDELNKDLRNAQIVNPALTYKLNINYDESIIEVKVLDIEKRKN